MAQRNYNLLNFSQRRFGALGEVDFGGWSVVSGSATITKVTNLGFYNTYIPGEEFANEFSGSVLFIAPQSASADIVLESSFFDVTPGLIFMPSVVVSSKYAGRTVELGMKFFQGSSSPSADFVDGSATRVRELSPAESPHMVLQRITNSLDIRTDDLITPSTERAAKISLTFSGLEEDNEAFVIFDPFVAEDDLSESLSGVLSSIGYQSLPQFMRLDDENINDILPYGTTMQVLEQPLKRYMETLFRPADTIAETAATYELVRPTDASLELPASKSALTDPDTAASNYLPWLASTTGTRLIVAEGGGVSPWAAVERTDANADGTPGQWNDLEKVGSWIGLETLPTDDLVVDNTETFRNLISTGFTGINSGRPDAISNFLHKTVGEENFKPIIKSNDKDNPFLLEVLVDPGTDLGGSYIKDFASFGLSSGSTIESVSSVVDSGDGSFDFSKLVYPATESTESATGAVLYGKSFISDADGFGRHLLLSPGLGGAASATPELGGGVSDAHYYSGGSYVYGNTGPSSYGSITAVASTVPAAGNGAVLDLGGNTEGYEIIISICDFTLPQASTDTGGTGNHNPVDWLYREKRLIACGTDAGGSNNDWALYLVSGATTSIDTETRLLLIDGYNAVTSTNYAVSDPIDFGEVAGKGHVNFRVKRSAKSGSDATVTFYAQGTLYDDWELHSVGEVVFQPDSDSVSGAATASPHDAGVQILGELPSPASPWAQATPLSCCVQRFMLFNNLIVFGGESETSASAHAYVAGGEVSDYGNYSYAPTVDINFMHVDPYTEQFYISDYVEDRRSGLANTIDVQINSATANGLDVYAFRRSDPAHWYFGYTEPGTTGDVLTLDGLTPSTNYVVIPSVVNTSDGTVSTAATNTFQTNPSGVLTLAASANYYSGSASPFGGTTLAQIEVEHNSNVVGRFLPTTISASATYGSDDVSASATWTLARSFPVSSADRYVPSQVIDRDFLHVFEGAPQFGNCPELEVFRDFSVLVQCRRFWTAAAGTEFDILRIETDDPVPKGLRVFYDGPYIKATFSDGFYTEEVSWTESPAFGEWQWFVVRRDISGLSLVPPNEYDSSDVVEENNVLVEAFESTAVASADTVFESPTSVMKLGHDDGDGSYNARFGLSEFVFFDRRLTDAEIELLSTQIS